MLKHKGRGMFLTFSFYTIALAPMVLLVLPGTIFSSQVQRYVFSIVAILFITGVIFIISTPRPKLPVTVFIVCLWLIAIEIGLARSFAGLYGSHRLSLSWARQYGLERLANDLAPLALFIGICAAAYVTHGRVRLMLRALGEAGNKIIQDSLAFATGTSRFLLGYGAALFVVAVIQITMGVPDHNASWYRHPFLVATLLLLLGVGLNGVVMAVLFRMVRRWM